ncbi:MAG: hypothetical protein CO133_02700 [Candidatus Komeilibacteria bacterium CG_4_9_14_3_um_filter_37_5]|nr:MAG: hypothetical protein CO133_02700 [Candidatus Komeilibacteria bacterium CG_4_9_14_3_um_filter_37_5]
MMEFRKKQLSYLAVFVIAVSVFGFAFWQVQKNIAAPFALQIKENTNSNEQHDNLFLTETEKMEKLKKVDSDNDGLSDYLELYIYNTSPYLDDSDSDGVTDKDEVLAGSDPNCVGENCGNIKDTGGVEQIEKTAPEMIRELMTMGFGESELKKMTESELKTLYADAKVVAGSNVNVPEELSKLTSPENIDKLSVEQIKAILIQGGAKAEDLANVTESELKEIFKKVINQQNNNK